VATITLNNILEFIKQFVQWQDQNKSSNFQVLSETQYRDGTLLRVNREAVTNRGNKAQVSTLIWLPKNKTKPFLYVFLDTLSGYGIRNLSHRIQILSSDREPESVKINIYLSQSYYLGTHSQANTILLKLIFYCHSRPYETVNWDWEIQTCRKQLMGLSYTDYSQEKARENNQFNLDRFELRFSAPRNLSPTLFEHVAQIIEPPKKEPPRSRVIELFILGGIAIGIAVLLIKPSTR
jgi:hypothetical protein